VEEGGGEVHVDRPFQRVGPFSIFAVHVAGGGGARNRKESPGSKTLMVKQTYSTHILNIHK
jgi:hypothetical protein